MNRIRARRSIAGPIYGPARHRAVDAKQGAALARAGDSCRDVANSDPGAIAADASLPRIRVQAFHGDLDVSNRESIENTLGEFERFAPGTIAILDLSDVQYLDTTFLNALLRGAGRPRIVAPPRSMPSRIFAITKLDSQFDVFEDLAAAHASR